MNTSRSTSTHIDTIIIGGGIAGLTAAAFLAKAGRQVHLFERAEQLGGRGRTNEKEGVLFNIGAHALYKNFYAHTIFQELGLACKGGVVDPAGTLGYIDGELHMLPSGLFSLLTTSLLKGTQRWELLRTLASVGMLTPESYEDISYQDWLEQRLHSTRTRQIFEAFGRISTYGNAPALQSASAVLKPLQCANTHSVIYLDGGWQTLIHDLTDVVTKAGAVLHTKSSISQVELQQGQVHIHKADGQQLTCEQVILAVPPRAAHRMLGAHSPLTPWMETIQPIKAACLDVALKELPNPERTSCLGLDEPYYYSVHTKYAQLAEEGHVIHLAKYLPPEEKTGSKEELESFLELLQPGWREHLITSQFLPGMTVAQDFAKAESGGLQGRVPVQFPDIKGLYFAWDWVGTQGQLADASAASAKLAATSILA